MRLTCTVEILNRTAAELGLNGRNRPCKSIVQIRENEGSSSVILVSTMKEAQSQQYNVNKISKIRSTFLHEGKATIEMMEPPINLMMRDCQQARLDEFIKKLQTLKSIRNNKENAPQNPGTSTSEAATDQMRTTVEPTTSSKTLPEERPLRRGSGDMKRKRNLLSQSEEKSIRKRLREKCSSALVITERKNYPYHGFPCEVQDLTVSRLSLKKVDTRWYCLENLTSLNISDNRLTSIQDLTKLKCRLVLLNVSGNQLETLEEDIFYADALRGLKSLDLSKNKLKSLTPSILELRNLIYLTASDNQLHNLPYNMYRLRNLRTLNVNKNKLKFLPYVIIRLNLVLADLSENEFATPSAVQEIRNVGKKKMTLMELAASAILKHNDRQPNQQYRTDPGQIPWILRRVLERSFMCHRCRNFCIPYVLCGTFVRNINVASECITSSVDANRLMGYIPVKLILCNACSLAADIHRLYFCLR